MSAKVVKVVEKFVDADPRLGGRRIVEVLEVEGDRAVVQGKMDGFISPKTKIKISRLLTPRLYRRL